MKTAFGVFLLVLSSASFASTWHADNIKRIYPLANGQFVITFATPHESCTNDSKYFYVKVGANGMTQEGADNIYSLAMLAASTGKTIKVNFDETSNTCDINRAYVNF